MIWSLLSQMPSLTHRGMPGWLVKATHQCQHRDSGVAFMCTVQHAVKEWHFERGWILRVSCWISLKMRIWDGINLATWIFRSRHGAISGERVWECQLRREFCKKVKAKWNGETCRWSGRIAWSSPSHLLRLGPAGWDVDLPCSGWLAGWLNMLFKLLPLLLLLLPCHTYSTTKGGGEGWQCPSLAPSQSLSCRYLLLWD